MQKTLILLILLSLSVSRANVVGVDTQNFNTTTSGLDFITVHSSETLEPGYFNLGFFLNYSKNTLPYFDGGEEGDSILAADLNMGVGLGKNWDFGISFPYLLEQSLDTDADLGYFEETGNTEIRVNTKYRFFGNSSGGLAAILSVSFNQIENNPFVGDKSGPIYTLELAGDTTLKNKIAMGANIGYRFRDPGEQLPDFPEIEPFQNQWIASLAASYYFDDVDLKLISEIYGSTPAESTELNTNREQSSLEFITGIKYQPSSQLALHLGAGKEILNGSATPDWRVYTGVNWTFGPLFGGVDKPQAATVDSVYKLVTNESGDVEIVDIDSFDLEPEENETFVIKDIKFAFNSDILDRQSLKNLDKFANYLKRPPEMELLVIEGHTDSIGSAAYNLDLSKRRAKAVGLYLVRTHGLPVSKVKAYGYGEGRPLADNGNFQGRERNRRVEFKVKRRKQ